MTSKEKVKKVLEKAKPNRNGTGWGAGVPMTDENGKSHSFDPFNPKKGKINRVENYDDTWPLNPFKKGKKKKWK